MANHTAQCTRTVTVRPEGLPTVKAALARYAASATAAPCGPDELQGCNLQLQTTAKITEVLLNTLAYAA